MARITRSDDISVLALDKRISNAFRRTGINSIADMLSYDKLCGFSKIRNIGQKNIEKIQEVIEKIKNHSQEFYLVEMDAFMNLEGNGTPNDVSSSVEKMDISDTAKYFLKMSGYCYVYQLYGMTASGLWATRNREIDVDYSLMEEIVNTMIDLEEQHAALPSKQHDESDNDIVSFLAREISDKFNGSFHTVHNAILEAGNRGGQLYGKDYCKRLYELPAIRELVIYWLLDTLEAQETGISQKEVEKEVPEHLQGTEVISEILSNLEQDGKIWSDNGRWYRKFPSIIDYVREIEYTPLREMATLRLEGRTLNDIGDMFNMTRESVRLRLKRIFDMRPKVREDVYAYLYQHYEISKEEFIAAFGETLITFNYLSICLNKQESQPLSEAKYDSNISADMLVNIKRIENQKNVSIYGMSIPRERNALVEFILKNECCKTITYNKFLKHYHSLLELLGLSDDPEFEISSKSYENKLSQSLNILWSPGKQFRYYDMSSRDFKKLRDTIDLKEYYGMVVSAIELFEEYKELMDRYDIWNGYELHNLLKKIEFGKEENVVYERNPAIRIGTVE